METELLKVFDSNRIQTGVASREEVHRLGHWHEVFHCWFASSGRRGLSISSASLCDEKDYPNYGILRLPAIYWHMKRYTTE